MQDIELTGHITYTPGSFTLLYTRWRKGVFSTSIKALQSLFESWNCMQTIASKNEIEKIQPLYEKIFMRIVGTDNN
jgi:hypothetical protein